MKRTQTKTYIFCILPFIWHFLRKENSSLAANYWTLVAWGWGVIWEWIGRAWGNYSRWWMCHFCNCVDGLTSVYLYHYLRLIPLNMCPFLYANYIMIKLKRGKLNNWTGIQSRGISNWQKKAACPSVQPRKISYSH